MDEIDCACGKILQWQGRPSYSPWGRIDRYGIYAGIHCDACWDKSSMRDYEFDESYAGERLEEDLEDE